MNTRFKIKTVVDITNHISSYRENKLHYGQKQNFMTVLNTIGLRVNPTVESDPILNTSSTAFGKNAVWEFEFSVEYEGALTIEMMLDDFMLIPFISGLEETAKFNENVFVTKGKDKNIVFEYFDK